jgi:sortase (surface protein transpeptidase)
VLHQSEASAAIIPAPPTVHTTTTAWEPAADTTTTASSAAPDAVVVSTLVSASSTTTTMNTHPVLDPARVIIPALGVDALLIHAGLRENGSVELPPYGLAAWYKLGPAPGANGPAVIFAHNDSKKGRDIFYHLGRLQKGDIVQVYGDDGPPATFAIDRVEVALKTEFPSERVWDFTDEPVIRLITCGGAFDRDSGHYLSNIIAYGHLIE